MDKCVISINAMLPEYLKGLSINPTMVVPADSTTTDLICTEEIPCTEELKCTEEFKCTEELKYTEEMSCTEELKCTEELVHENSNSSEGTYLDSEYSSLAPPTPSSIRSSSPLSAVDIFTDFTPMFDSVDQNNTGLDSFATILVS